MVFSGSQALIPTRIDCPYANAAEQKARSTYEYLIDLTDDPDVLAPLRFLREREIVHFQRFGESSGLRQRLSEAAALFLHAEKRLQQLTNHRH